MYSIWSIEERRVSRKNDDQKHVENQTIRSAREKKPNQKREKRHNTQHLKCFILLCRFLRKKNKRIIRTLTRECSDILIQNEWTKYHRCNTCATLSLYMNCFDFCVFFIQILSYTIERERKKNTHGKYMARNCLTNWTQE